MSEITMHEIKYKDSEGNTLFAIQIRDDTMRHVVAEYCKATAEALTPPEEKPSDPTP